MSRAYAIWPAEGPFVRTTREQTTSTKMRGKSSFSPSDADSVRGLLRELQQVSSDADQKRIRDQLRSKLGFYISDWTNSSAGFTVDDFDDLIAAGRVEVSEHVALPAPESSSDATAPTPSEPPAADAEAGRSSPESTKEILAAFETSACAIAEAWSQAPDAPGLYAIFGSPDTWRELGLGEPAGARPLYIGKAERSLRSRDLKTHFKNGRTGSSTVRRSIAALLHDKLGLTGIPRNPDKPGYFFCYGLSEADDQKLTGWMSENLKLGTWTKPQASIDLIEIERILLNKTKPPLNLQDVATEWQPQVTDARAVMADEARAWTVAQGKLS